MLQLQTRSTTELYVDVEDKTQVHTLLQQAMQPLSISLNPEHFLLRATYNCYVKQVVSRTVIERKGDKDEYCFHIVKSYVLSGNL